jgi:type IV pilus assembly protein PilA
MNEGAKAGLVSLLTYRHRKHQMNKNKKQSGFTLIELLIVVAIILIIAAIAIPNMLTAKATAQASSAAASLRTLNTGVATFAASYPGTQSVTDLAQLGKCPSSGGPIEATPCVIDPFWATAVGVKGGYTFTLTYTSDANYLLLADPNTATSSKRHFGVDQGGSIWYNDSGALTEPLNVSGNTALGQ